MLKAAYKIYTFLRVMTLKSKLLANHCHYSVFILFVIICWSGSVLDHDLDYCIKLLFGFSSFVTGSSGIHYSNSPLRLWHTERYIIMMMTFIVEVYFSISHQNLSIDVCT